MSLKEIKDPNLIAALERAGLSIPGIGQSNPLMMLLNLFRGGGKVAPPSVPRQNLGNLDLSSVQGAPGTEGIDLSSVIQTQAQPQQPVVPAQKKGGFDLGKILPLLAVGGLGALAGKGGGAARALSSFAGTKQALGAQRRKEDLERSKRQSEQMQNLIDNIFKARTATRQDANTASQIARREEQTRQDNTVPIKQPDGRTQLFDVKTQQPIGDPIGDPEPTITVTPEGRIQVPDEGVQVPLDRATTFANALKGGNVRFQSVQGLDGEGNRVFGRFNPSTAQYVDENLQVIEGFRPSIPSGTWQPIDLFNPSGTLVGSGAMNTRTMEVRPFKIAGEEGIVSTKPPKPLDTNKGQRLAGHRSVRRSIDILDKAIQTLASGPIRGRMDRFLFSEMGGLGLDPEVQEAIAEVETLITKESFRGGGKQLTPTEIARITIYLPKPEDTLEQAMTKLRIAREVSRLEFATFLQAELDGRQRRMILSEEKDGVLDRLLEQEIPSVLKQQETPSGSGAAWFDKVTGQ